MLLQVVRFILSILIVLVCGVTLLVVGTLFAKLAKADSPIEVQKVSLEYRSLSEGSRYPLITDNALLPNRKVDKELVLNLNSYIYQYFYWNNRVITYTDKPETGGSGQFRTVAWEYKLGFRVFSWLNLEMKHRSEHTLETQHQSAYPVQDSIGVEIFLLGKERQWGFF